MLIKDYYDQAYIDRMARQITAVCPAFPGALFAEEVGGQLSDQRYSEKMLLIAEGLRRYLPDYSEALSVFRDLLGEPLASMGEMYTAGMDHAPLGKFIECYAVENEAVFPQTVAFIHALTQRYSGEFAMRPLLAAFPERTLTVLREWSTDEHDCVRRLCSECMRISLPWASKLTFALDYFDDYCGILVRLADDRCEYVRRSVANNLNDLYKADRGKAALLTDRLRAVNGPHTRALLTHGTRWARKQGLL